MKDYANLIHALREKESRDNRALLDAAADAIEKLSKDLGTVQSANEILAKGTKIAYKQGIRRIADLLLTMYSHHDDTDEITVGELRRCVDQITRDLTEVAG